MPIIYVLLVLAGLIVGGLGIWLWTNARVAGAQRKASAAEGTITELRTQIKRADEDFRALRTSLDAEREARVKAETQHAEAARNLEEQKMLIEESKRMLADTFKALSDDALKSNNQAFLELAKKSLETVLTEGKGDIEKRRQAIDALVKPLSESLKQYENHIKALEESRQKAYGTLEEQVRSLNETQKDLRDKTGNLVTALRKPEVRGTWGEMTLKRVAELAGMSGHCDFSEQVSVKTEDGTKRPDMVVQLPAGRQIVVDSKVALDAYLDAFSAKSDEERQQHLQRHARQMRAHMNKLSQKSYWEQFSETPEFVVMFVPGESFFAAAVECDGKLIEDGMGKRVVLATPTTLIALLRAVAYGWRQEQVTRNAQEICYLGKQLYERLRRFSEHLEGMRKGLERATEAYNKAVGSLETRVFPAARRFRDLGVTASAEIEAAEPVETTPRVLNPPDGEEED